MTINELATESGVTTRTIRYYVEQGLLPNPEVGYPAQYTDEHLQRLALIRRLKEEYLPLDEIKNMLQGLNADEIAALLAEHSANPPPPKPANLLTSASDYINQVLGRGQVREQMKQNYGSPVPASPPAITRQEQNYAPPAPASSPAPAAAVYKESEATEQTLDLEEALPLPATSAPAATPPPAPAPSAAPPLRRARIGPTPAGAADNRKVADADKAASGGPLAAAESAALPTEAAGAETWRRIVLLPGIELHIAVHEDRRFNRIVARLLEAAHRILAEEPEKAEDNL